MIRRREPSAVGLRVAVLLVAALAVGACGRDAGEPDVVAGLEGLPELPAGPPPELPPLDAAELAPAVGEQLTAQHRRVSELSGDVDATTRADAFGELGRLYHSYRFLDAAEVCYLGARHLAPRTPRWPHLLGHVYELRGEYELAAAAYREALAAGPQSPPLWLRLATALARLGRHGDAAPLFREVLAADPSSAAAHYELGLAASERGDAAAAREHLEKALESAPGASVIHHPLGLAYRQLGDLERAREHLAQAGDRAVIFPDPEIDALRGLRRTAGDLLTAGTARDLAGDLDAAIEEYRQAVAAFPEDFEARLALGAALSRRGDAEAALHLQEARHLAPDSALAHSQLAFHHAARGALEEAERLFRHALELQPEYEEARLGLAQVLARQERHPEAIAQYDAALRVDPREVGTRLLRAESLLALGREAEARQELDAVLEAEPGHPGASFRLAALHQEGGDSEAAVALYRGVLERAPDPAQGAWAHYKLGVLLARRGEEPEALAQFEQAVGLQPDFVDALYNLGVALSRAQRSNEALVRFRRVLELRPADGRARVAEAAELMRGGSYAAARETLEQGHALTPGDSRIVADLARLLAASPRSEVRDGRRALELAQRLFAAEASLQHAELLAMALAEAGQLAAAADLQSRAVAAAEGARQWELAATLRANLARYRAGQSCCAPSSGSG